MAQTHYPHITDNAINQLCRHNIFFKQSIDYFITQESQNLEKITASNIKTIENPKNQQPTDCLNKLPLPIKTYVMNEALKKINYVYDIVLKEHRNNIVTFDICEHTDQAIISSFNENPFAHIFRNYDSQLILWSLKTGKPLHTFSESDPVSTVTFNSDGSHIAGALYTENAIKVWCIQTKQLLHKLSSSYSIKHLTFSHPTGSLLTALYYDHEAIFPTSYMQQWSLFASDNKAGELINSSYCFGGRGKNDSFSGDKYLVRHPRLYVLTPKNELHITKKDCAPLFLCMKAIEKTNNLKRELIESSASFHQLTDLEKPKVYNEIQKKLTQENKSSNTIK
jgi:WD40 repeat protein